MTNLKHEYKVYCDNGTSLRSTFFVYSNRECLKEHIIRFVRDEVTRLTNEGYVFIDVYESGDTENAISIGGVKNNIAHISKVFVRRVN